MFDMFSRAQFDTALLLIHLGLTDGQSASACGVSRRTVRRWRTTRRPPGEAWRRRRPAPGEWTPPCRRSYGYLLGLYLGDGYVANAAGSPFLQISLDARYPGIVSECRRALAATFAGATPHIYERRGSECRVVQLSSPKLPAAFPQHGPGRKHERSIELSAWQREITRPGPRPLLRGLLHSDGCRCVNRFRTALPSGRTAEYAYARYFLSNLSPDIRRIFCEHCELLGIRWSQSNARNISVSDRCSVAALDVFVGPKR